MAASPFLRLPPPGLLALPGRSQLLSVLCCPLLPVYPTPHHPKARGLVCFISCPAPSAWQVGGKGRLRGQKHCSVPGFLGTSRSCEPHVPTLLNQVAAQGAAASWPIPGCLDLPGHHWFPLLVFRAALLSLRSLLTVTGAGVAAATSASPSRPSPLTPRERRARGTAPPRASFLGDTHLPSNRPPGRGRPPGRYTRATLALQSFRGGSEFRAREPSGILWAREGHLLGDEWPPARPRGASSKS